ncbi:DNA adenine methylase [Pseudoalteromonas sp. Hal040]|uniref:DNA adenine methylase n=2 Tax=unclassified Pseudoalteromonas TaxID=194690 RepID=UPI00301E1CDC
MAGRTFYTPLRYPGGKGKFAGFIKDLFLENSLCDGHYMEPFAGGAGIALELLFEEYASHIHLNDLDPAVYSFWDSVLNDTEALVKLIHDTPVTIEQWYKQREVLTNLGDVPSLELGFATFFLNRCNRSGILKAGVIGGKAQSGAYKLDCRFNKSNLIHRIEKVALYRNRVSLYNLDAVELLGTIAKSLPQKSLIYLDPPYYVKGSGLYRNFYNHEDHVQIERSISEVKTPWIVSYDNVPEIRKIYGKHKQDAYFLSYTAQDKKVGSEVMIYGPGVKCSDATLEKVS